MFEYKHNESVANAIYSLIEASGYVVEFQTIRGCVWWDKNIWYSMTTTVKHRASNDRWLDKKLETNFIGGRWY